MSSDAGYPRDPQDAVCVVQEHLALWLGMGLTPAEAWEALTGRRDRRFVSWAEVRGYMIGWWCRQHADHGSARRLWAA